jgi:hypothetical protein
MCIGYAAPRSNSFLDTVVIIMLGCDRGGWRWLRELSAFGMGMAAYGGRRHLTLNYETIGHEHPSQLI